MSRPLKVIFGGRFFRRAGAVWPVRRDKAGCIDIYR